MGDVLIFEREMDFAQCLADFIKSCGHEAEITDSPEAVRESLSKVTPTYLVCDLLKDPATESLLKSLCQSNQKPVRTVFTSIYRDPAHWPILREYAGPYLYLPKPFPTEALIQYLFPELP